MKIIDTSSAKYNFVMHQNGLNFIVMLGGHSAELQAEAEIIGVD